MTANCSPTLVIASFLFICTGNDAIPVHRATIIILPHLEEVQKRLGMSQRITPLQREPKLSGSRGTVPPTHFMDHRAGKRLGIFEYPKPGQKVMPPHEPTLEEVSVLFPYCINNPRFLTHVGCTLTPISQ